MRSKKIKRNLIKFNPIAVSVLLSIPVVTCAADLSMINGSTVMANGVPVVNINQANENGISHNVYDKLNVGKEGIIFNNSQNGASTVLAGQIAGNSNLASGAAKVILNEVTSRNASTLSGMMEVAGDKAHLIIANPNGITCASCGFINTEKATLTTGKPDMQNGQLKGYSVNGGIITTNGLTSDSPTAILARSVVVNGDIRAEGQSIDVVTGNNYVNTDNQVTGTVTGTGWRNGNSIDVAKLGGMYADRISLTSTENGIGVRNLGTLSGGAGNILINTKGQLINTAGQIKAAGPVNILTNGKLDNTSGKILSNQTIGIDTTKNTIDNNRGGNIMSSADIYVSSGALNNTNGKIAASGTLGVNTNNATLTNNGKGAAVGIEAGIVALQTGAMNNNGGQIKGYYVGTSSTSVSNTNGGTIDSNGNIDMVSTGNVNNNGGRIRTATGRLLIDAAKSTISNSSTRTGDFAGSDALGIIGGEGGVQLSAASVNNSNGQIISANKIAALTTGAMNNSNGKIQSEYGVDVKAGSMSNNQGSTTTKGDINIETSGSHVNNLGIYMSDEGALNFKTATLNNTGGLMKAIDVNVSATGNVDNSAGLISGVKSVTVNTNGALSNQNSGNFGRYYGIYLGMDNQEGGLVSNGNVTITANSVNNDNSRIVAENGALNMTVNNTLSSSRSMLVGGSEKSSIKANTLNTHYSTIYSAGDLDIDVKTLNMYNSGNLLDNNATGVISSDGALDIKIGSSYNNTGWISGKNKTTISSTGILTNRNTIFSENDLDVYGKTAVYNYGDMVGNTAANVVSDGLIYNSSNMFSEGTVSVKGKTITNTGSNAVLGGRKGTTLNSTPVTGNGRVIGL